MTDSSKELGIAPAGPHRLPWARTVDEPAPDTREHSKFLRLLEEHIATSVPQHARAGAVYARGDFFGERTEEIYVRPVSLAETPGTFTELVEGLRGWLTRTRHANWRIVLPLVSGSVVVYPDAICTERRLADNETSDVLEDLILQAAVVEQGWGTQGPASVADLENELALARRSMSDQCSAALVGLPSTRGERAVVWVLHYLFPWDLEPQPSGDFEEVYVLKRDGSITDYETFLLDSGAAEFEPGKTLILVRWRFSLDKLFEGLRSLGVLL